MSTVKTEIRNQTIWLYVPNLALHQWSTWQHEPEILDFIDALRSDDIFLDLGAAEGRFSLYAAKKGLQTIAFEPDKYNFVALEVNRQINKLANLTTYKKGVGAHNHIANLVNGAPWAGGHHKVIGDAIGRKDLAKIVEQKEVEEVEIVALDDFLKDQKVTAVKVDVDGSENEFMAGAKQFLLRPEIKNVMMELYRLDPNYQFILSNFARMGFDIYKKYVIEPDHFGNGNLYNIWFRRT